MAAVVCTQCGAEAPQSPDESAAPVRCRFCGHTFGAPKAQMPPPAVSARAVIGAPPPRRTGPQVPAPQAVSTEDTPQGAARPRRTLDPLSQPFDAQDIKRPKEPGPRRLWGFVLLLAVGGLGAAVMMPVQMGLSPDWYRALVGKRVDPMAQAELEHGNTALDRGSSRGLIEAKQCFERALKIDDHFAPGYAGLAEAELAMAEALNDAAQDMAHFSQGLSRKEMRRAQHDADTQRTEAKAWIAAAVSAAQTAVQLAPNTPAANRVMADLLRQQADVKGATAWAKGGRSAITQDAGMLVVQADLIADHDLAGACALLAQALDKAPANNRARYRLAQNLLKKKDSTHALEAVNAILASAPEHELAQQMLMRLQPAASQAEKVQRPLVLSFATEMHPDVQAAQLAARVAEAGGADTPAPSHLADADGDHDADEAAVSGPPLTFIAQAKLGVQNVWRSLGSMFSGAGGDAPEPVAPSDLGGGMPIPSGPSPAAPAAEPQSAERAAAPKPPVQMPAPQPRPMPAAPAVDKAVQAAAQAPVPSILPSPTPVPQAPMGHLPADAARLSVADLTQRGHALLEAHNAQDALALYQLAAKRAPLETTGLLGVGFCELELGANDAAAAAFNEALRLSSWQAEPHFGLAQALKAQGHAREAVGHYRRYLAIEPGGPRASVARQMLEELSK